MMTLSTPPTSKSWLGSILAAAVCLIGTLAGTPAQAAPKLRFQVDQRGDMLILGNTFGQECRTDVTIPKPVVGTVGDCGLIGVNDSAPDVFWRSGDDGTASADIVSVIPATARSSAQLKLPAGPR